MSFFQKAYQFVRYDIWRRTAKDISKSKRFGYNTLKTLVLTIRGFAEDEVNTRANALTYSMLFATVPLIAMSFAIAKGFGFEQTIEDKLNSVTFLRESNIVPTIMEFVQRYLETAQGGVFLGIGIVILIWSIYNFFRTVETSFNTIWEVNRSRSYLRQITTYLSILLAIPIMMVLSSGMSIFFNSALSGYFGNTQWLTEFLIKAVPFIVCWIIFSWMYWAIPNTKVGFQAAVIPGIIVGTVFQLLQMLSVYILVFLSRTSIVYGTFAAIPLLLVWLHLSCLILLLGAEMSYAIQNNEYYDYDQDLKLISRRYKDYITLYLVYLIVKRFEQEQLPPTAHELAQENNIPIRLVNNLLSRLTESNILREIYIENKEDKTYLPAIDINRLTVGKLFSHIDRQGNERFLQNLPEKMEAFWQEWTDLQAKTADSNNILIKDL